jgi:hypothetical protein
MPNAELCVGEKTGARIERLVCPVSFSEFSLNAHREARSMGCHCRRNEECPAFSEDSATDFHCPAPAACSDGWYQQNKSEKHLRIQNSSSNANRVRQADAARGNSKTEARGREHPERRLLGGDAEAIEFLAVASHFHELREFVKESRHESVFSQTFSMV